MITTSIKDRVAGLLTQILGKAVTGENVPASTVTVNNTPGVVATYETGAGEVVAILASNLDIVANAGAALCMMPPYVAQESIKAKKLLEPTLAENYHEVLNICARLFSDIGEHRVRLRDVQVVNKIDCKSLIVDPACSQREIGLTIAGYGRGYVWICTQKAFNSVLF